MKFLNRRLIISIVMVFGVAGALGGGPSSFVNWETPHVHPVDITPDGNTLLAVNTSDNRLEVFDITTGMAVHDLSIPVGLDPVTVRAQTNTEAWVVNHISDSVSIVNLLTGHVVLTLRTADEPCDVVFAGTPRRAFISCAQASVVMVFDLANLSTPVAQLTIEGEEPRAMVVNPDTDEVNVAIFESGNRTTILGGGSTMSTGFPPNVVNDPLSPYFNTGQSFQLGVNPPNPPPNSGSAFNPPIGGGLPTPPRVGLIVRKNTLGQWMDDNAHDWTPVVSGANAANSGRPVGWDLVEHDVAMIHASSLVVRYASDVMNVCMALAYNAGTEQVTVVGTEATNEVRFEPVLGGRFLRVNIGLVDPVGPTTDAVVDLNPHLTYTTDIPFVPIPQADRDLSLGDPRGICWDAAGTIGYISGMGSNNVAVIDSAGARVSGQDPISVGEGPTGLVLDESRERLYVLNKFGSSISIINTVTNTEITQVPLFDPSPSAIKIGRKHLYDTHRNSGLGHIACASCHVDSRIDRLSWDLGDPSGSVKPFNQNCAGGGCQSWHPMKGPMTTQTLQDIIGKEPHHWRGDRNGIEEFAGAFQKLLGDDGPLPNADMQEFENFLATIHFPPNPFRNFFNQLPTSLALPGHFTTGRFGAAGQPLSNGNAVTGLSRYRTGFLDGVHCVTCHTLPTGIGLDGTFVGFNFVPISPGPLGERHHGIVSVDGSTNVSIKIPQLRNMYKKVGFEATQARNVAGFGFLHDGSVDSLARFVTEPVFNLVSDQDVANMVAFMLSFAGSDLPVGAPNSPLEGPGPDGQDTHSAVGWQTTLIDETTASAAQLNLISDMIALANSNAAGLVVKGLQGGIMRGYRYNGGNVFQSDRVAETLSASELRAAATLGNELTYTVVPKGSETRIGIDRDLDGSFDRDEIDGCSDPADAVSLPPLCVEVGACCDFSVIPGCSTGVSESACVGSGGIFHGIGSTCVEICDDGIDNDCDGATDTADADCGCGPCQLYADIYPIGPPAGSCVVDLDDLLCLLQGFVNPLDCAGADLYPCGGNGLIDVDDLLALLEAFADNYLCPHPCAP
ncbi:MAG: hypothetical protein AABZ47_08340 [Planctomycetota bacterium]